MSTIFRNIVKICDVTLRDGIQSLKNKTNPNLPIFNSSSKLNIINRLAHANINNIEFGSNVSHKLVEMSNTQEVVKSFDVFAPKSNLYLLVPNHKKYQEVYNWANMDKVSHLSLITACSETFVKKNTNMTIKESLAEIDKIIQSTPFKVRLYISTCFGCPFEGETNLGHIKNISNIFEKYSAHPKIHEIVISDTIGSYDMKQLNEYMDMFGSTKKVSLHLHTDEMDSNIPDLISKYKYQLVSIDTSLGQIGGCPSVAKSKVRPNLSTLKVAQIINSIEDKKIYNLEALVSLDELVRENIYSN
jgi:hydroxymethylglutaryl-CoA lyase